MKANNLTISIPNVGCDKNCPYCVSKMTGYMEKNINLFYKNIKKAKTIADNSGVNSILITGKGEPCLNEEVLFKVLEEFKEYPTELQTNGLALRKNPLLINKLSIAGLNVIAMSVDTIGEITLNKETIKRAKKLGILTRFTFNLTNMFESFLFNDIFTVAKNTGIDQVSFREITIPTGFVNTKESLMAVDWIYKHVNPEYIKLFKKEMKESLDKSGRFLMKHSYGAKIYDLEGVSVTWFDYCVQDSNNEDDIRSLIYQEDGHLYYTWNSPASKVF